MERKQCLGSLLSPGLRNEGKTLVGMLSGHGGGLLDYRGPWNVLSLRVFPSPKYHHRKYESPEWNKISGKRHLNNLQGKLRPRHFPIRFIPSKYAVAWSLSLIERRGRRRISELVESCSHSVISSQLLWQCEEYKWSGVSFSRAFCMPQIP